MQALLPLVLQEEELKGGRDYEIHKTTRDSVTAVVKEVMNNWIFLVEKLRFNLQHEGKHVSQEHVKQEVVLSDYYRHVSVEQMQIPLN